jgi:hypothetical protein
MDKPALSATAQLQEELMPVPFATIYTDILPLSLDAFTVPVLKVQLE